MAKKTYKVRCESIQQGNNRGAVILSIDLPPAPPAKPGEAPVRVAKTVINLIFTDPKEASSFEVNKTYTVSIE